MKYDNLLFKDCKDLIELANVIGNLFVEHRDHETKHWNKS